MASIVVESVWVFFQMLFFFFFFFQAEDGIRDYKVTGVQTCALPISTLTPSLRAAWRRPARRDCRSRSASRFAMASAPRQFSAAILACSSPASTGLDRKSTRLNSSHLVISYAVFCLKKKKKNTRPIHDRPMILCRNYICSPPKLEHH